MGDYDLLTPVLAAQSRRIFARLGFSKEAPDHRLYQFVAKIGFLPE